MSDSITLAELFELIVLFSLPISALGRICQFFYLYLRLNLLPKKIILILVVSEFISWILTGVFWFKWPFKTDIMFHFVCLPTLGGEIILLVFTGFVFKKGVKSWA